MKSYLLRLEALNFDSFVLDTADLSTIRGGGLLLLDAPSALEEMHELEIVYAGASQSVYQFRAETESQAETIRAQAESLVHAGARSEATIAVVVEPLTEDFAATMLRLQNRVRWEQLRTPSVVYPAAGQQGLIDEIDDIRPAREWDDFRKPREEGEDEGRPWILSRSTKDRRDYGVREKFGFYDDRASWAESPWREAFPFHSSPGEYVNDFEQLATCPGKGRVNRKIAYIYLDGNGFGAIAGRCNDPESRRRFSDLLHSNQNSFLHWLLSVQSPVNGEGMGAWHWTGETSDNRGRRLRKDRAFRIETLLWGGDEILWAVPAWCGWWVLGNFFSRYGKLPWRDEVQPSRVFHNNDGTANELCHGGAIVFCHANAPVRRVRKLTQMLADRPKENKSVDQFAYQVLESFDHLGTEADEVRQGRLPKSVRAGGKNEVLQSLVLGGAGMLGIIKPMEEMRQRFPRSKLHDILHRLQAESAEDVHKYAQLELQANGLCEEFESLMTYFSASTPGHPGWKQAVTWTHLGELWDYTPKPDWRGPEWPDGE